MRRILSIQPAVAVALFTPVSCDVGIGDLRIPFSFDVNGRVLPGFYMFVASDLMLIVRGDRSAVTLTRPMKAGAPGRGSFGDWRSL